MTSVHQGEGKPLGDFEWDRFAQTLEMIRPAERTSLRKRKNGRVIASKAAPPVATGDTPVSFENWLWRIASRPECFLAILMLNVCSELLAPL